MNQARLRRFRRTQQLERLESRYALTGFTAYNGLFAGPGSHLNTTLYADIAGRDSAGPLRDVASGAETGVLLTSSAIGVNFGGNGVNASPDTAAALIFQGFVDFAAGNEKSIELDAGDAYQYKFENLDAGATYEFAGTAIRGNAGYTNRWTLVELVGADSFSAAHSPGNGVVTSGLAPNQVAIWTGDNSAGGQGFVAQWTQIDAGDDGEFVVTSTQYTGAVPVSIHASGQADGNKGYGLAGIRLIENVPAGPPAVVNVAAVDVMAFAARAGGRVTTTGGEVPTVTLYYGTSDAGTDGATWQHAISVGRVGGDFAVNLDGLSPQTKYYFRSYAENSLGSDWSDTTASFTTSTATAPTIRNLPATGVGAFAAVANGQVVSTGNDTPWVTVFWGDHNGGTSSASWDHSFELGLQTGNYAATLAGLTPLKSYYFTARAQNSLGTHWATPALSFTTIVTPPLQITEFMADNQVTLSTRVRTDVTKPFTGDALTPDWLELHNPTGQVTDLGGFHLTDELTEPRKWQFPAGTQLAAGGYLVVFASGLDLTDPRRDERGYLHTNFQLGSSAGRDLLLTDDQGQIVFAYRGTPLQSEDVAYGVDPAGESRYFTVPTPGRDNAYDTPRAPEISAGSRTFTESFAVTLTPELPTHTIRFTLNETVPTTASPIYTGPLTIAATTQLRAISVAPNGKTSQVVSASYVQLAQNVRTASSNLPYLVIETFGDGVPGVGTTFGDAFVAIIEPGADGRSRLTAELDLQTRAGMHVRGSSSSGFSKKQYRVELWDERNEDLKQPVLDMPSEADWIFYGPSEYDRVLISNPLMFELSNEMGRYATRTRWVEAYLNANGGPLDAADYVGLYAIMEVVEQGADRVDVGNLTTGAAGQPVQGGFVWKNDRGNPYVDPDAPTSAQRTMIDGWINNLRNAAASPNFKDPLLGYAQYADVDSFVDHNLLNMLSMNVDALRLSSYYHKTPTGKLAAGPIWDFDRALDSTDGRDNNPRTWFGTGDSTRYFDDTDRVMSWWPDLFQDPDFVQRYIDRWFELRAGQWSLASLNATIDAHAAQVSEVAARDYARWSGSRFGNFAGEVSHLKDWLRQRIEWIDSRWLTAPTPSLANSHVPAGTPVTLSAPAGQIYYTLDGSDPRGEDGAIRPSARLANGPILVNGFTRIVARAYSANHGASNQGYVPTGDDWSAPRASVFYNDPPAAAGTLVIDEVHYHPAAPTLAEQQAGFQDQDDFEFIELVNAGTGNIVLTGAKLSRVATEFGNEGVDFDLSQSPVATLTPGQRIVVVENLPAFRYRYGADVLVAGVWNGSLDNNRELLTLTGYNGATLQQFRYNDSDGWPERADGFGSSLERVAAISGDDRPEAWRASVDFGGSPGRAPAAEIGVRINEVLAHTDPPLTPSDSIELLNVTARSIDISGWYLSDSADRWQKYVVPAGTVLGPGQYRVFDEDDFNPTPLTPQPHHFALNGAQGDDVWLVIPGAAGSVAQFVDEVHFPATANGEAMGRFPDGSGGLTPMRQRTLGAANSAPRVGPVVISELHYAPAAPRAAELALEPALTADDLEFLELHNPTSSALDLTEWRIRGGVDFDFFPGTQLPARGTLLVASFDPTQPDNANRLAAFRRHHGINAAVLLVGGYSGQLADAGETVRLQRPDEPPVDDPSFIPRLLEDEVVYQVTPPWPNAIGNGQSLTRTASTDWGGRPESWLAAVPSPGTPPGHTGPAGDVNQDGQVDIVDVDLVCAAIVDGAPMFDLNEDGLLDSADLDWLVVGVLGSTAGDANVDGHFNSSDLIQVFQRGHYEDQVAGTSRWSDGDWNCDGEFDSSDLVAAFQAGSYAAASRPRRG